MTGIVILIIAIFILCFCLYAMVRMLKSLLKGRVAVWLHGTVNGKQDGNLTTHTAYILPYP